MSEVVTHKCPNCDGPLLFNPSEQNFHCEYCLSVFSESELEQFEQQNAADVKPLEEVKPAPEITATEDVAPEIAATETDTGTAAVEMELFSCPSCGAEIVTDLTTAATYCYYCHNPVVLQGRISGKFLPEKILPFAFEKEAATSQFLTWVSKKKFIPKDFFNQQQISKLTGVYFPYWLVEADLDGELNASATRVRVWRTGNYEYTQTKFFRLERQGKLNFKNLLKNALQKNSQAIIVDSVQPFNYDQTIPFKSQYLAGFQAEKRDIELASLSPELANQFKNFAEQMLADTMSGYTTTYNKEASIHLERQRGEYVLLPVWLLTYQNERGTEAEKAPYYYAMNGQTGKISGKLPIDKLKLMLFSAGVGSIVLILALIGGYFI